MTKVRFVWPVLGFLCGLAVWFGVVWLLGANGLPELLLIPVAVAAVVAVLLRVSMRIPNAVCWALVAGAAFGFVLLFGTLWVKWGTHSPWANH